MEHDPVVLDRVALRSWQDMWESAAPHAAEEAGMEVCRFGPVLATAAAAFPTDRCLNRIQGANEPGAMRKGQLKEAVEWMRLAEVEYTVSVSALPSACRAVVWLSGGFELRRRSVKFVRDTSALEGCDDSGAEIHRLSREADGFGFCSVPEEVFGLEPALSSLLFSLPARESWRCYVTIDPRDDSRVAACGAMYVEDGIAQLAIDATSPRARGRGLHRALLRRRILDAAIEGCHTVIAEVSEMSGVGAVHRNLARTGFEVTHMTNHWQRSGYRKGDRDIAVGHWPSVGQGHG